jgi:uncharacterized pyridoxal phosphate-containing UPF0001 family protein
LITDVLLEVNMAGEQSKFGLAPENVAQVLTNARDFDGVCVKGLMTVAPFVDNPEENREIFRKMRTLFLDLKPLESDNNIIRFTTLSMGMTNDYEIAIEEGATIVRIGTGLFGKRI